MVFQILRKYLQLEDKICDRFPIYRHGVRILAFDVTLTAAGLLGMAIFGKNIFSTVLLIVAAGTLARVPWFIKRFKETGESYD